MKIKSILKMTLINWNLSATNCSVFIDSKKVNAIFQKVLFQIKLPGTTIGRNESEWGQMGAIIILGTLGWHIDAPAAIA